MGTTNMVIVQEQGVVLPGIRCMSVVNLLFSVLYLFVAWAGFLLIYIPSIFGYVGAILSIIGSIILLTRTTARGDVLYRDLSMIAQCRRIMTVAAVLIGVSCALQLITAILLLTAWYQDSSLDQSVVVFFVFFGFIAAFISFLNTIFISVLVHRLRTGLVALEMQGVKLYGGNPMPPNYQQQQFYQTQVPPGGQPNYQVPQNGQQPGYYEAQPNGQAQPTYQVPPNGQAPPVYQAQPVYQPNAQAQQVYQGQPNGQPQVVYQTQQANNQLPAQPPQQPNYPTANQAPQQQPQANNQGAVPVAQPVQKS